MDENKRAQNGVLQEEENLRQEAAKVKGDLASANPQVREQAADELKKNPGLESSNGTPPSDRAAHRRH